MNTNQIPTTAQMKAALASIQPAKAVRQTGSGLEGVADTIATSLASTVTGVSHAGTGTINFIDRIATGYKFQRALDTGKLQLNPPAKRASKVK